MKLTYPDPPLTDGLVRLRPWREVDAAALAEAWADPAIQETCAVPEDHSEAVAAGWISAHGLRIERRLALDLVVSDESEVSVLGEVGLGPFDPQRKAAVLGFWIGSPHRGAGRAKAAVALLAEWALDNGCAVLLAQTTAKNQGSIGVLRSCGFVQLAPGHQRDAAETTDSGADAQTWIRRSTTQHSRL